MTLRKSLLGSIAPVAIFAATVVATPAYAGAEPYIGELVSYGFNFCPRGWAAANGQLLSIAQNTALFSILGTTYGGNGTTTFALPDLRGRVAMGDGTSAFGQYVLGESGGAETFSVLTTNMPAHTHTAALRAAPTLGDTNVPTDNSMARAPSGVTVFSTIDPTANMNAGDVQVSPTGSNVPVGKASPYTTMNYCIALQGIFPPRS